MSDDREEAAKTQTEVSAAQSGHQVGMQAQAKQVMERKNNPQFYDKFVESSLQDSERWGHLLEKFAPLLADDHILSNRREVFRQERQLLNRTRAEEAIAGASPGETLRNKPLLNALSQDIHPTLSSAPPLTAAGQATISITHEAWRPPISSEGRSIFDDVAKLATARHAMGVESAGSEALTTATTENRTVRDDESSSGSALGEVFD